MLFRSGIATGAKEIPGEVLEETGGRFSQNVALRDVKPEQSLTEGLGETAAMSALGGAGMGGTTGVLGRRAAEVAPPPPPATDTEQKKQEVEPPAPEEEQKERSLEELFAKEPAPAATPVTTNPEFVAEQAAIDELKADYNKRKAELDKLREEGKYVPPAKEAKNKQILAEIDARQAALDARTKAGETNVVQPDQGTSGASTELSAQSSVDNTAAAGAGTSKPSGVVSARPDATTVDEGKGQPAAPVTRTPASFAADIIAGKKLDTPEDVQYYQNNAKEIEAELKKVEVAPRPSKSEIKKEIAATESQVGELYDLDRDYGRFDDETADLYDSLKRGVLPGSMGLGTARLQAVLDRNKVELPALPDDYETMTAEEKAAANKAAIDEMAAGLESKRGVLPEWSALRADQRQVYLSQIGRAHV